jgi:FkbM family methyltransferase
VRSALRFVGILHLIQTSPFYRRISSGYEASFDSAMIASLKPGTRVFDIGANVGYYTKKFAEAVGPSGEVHAFEPVPASASKVRELQAQYPWIQVHQCALSDQAGELLMNAEDESTSPTNRIAFEGEHLKKSISVPVATFDQLVKEYGPPSLIKIDVEGYEWLVLQGAARSLKMSEIMHVFVEIHFALLESRGFSKAGNDIYKILEEAGFKSKFTDFSHLHAFRP